MVNQLHQEKKDASMSTKVRILLVVSIGFFSGGLLRAKEKATTLPNDFALSHEETTVGVIPSTTAFVRIVKTKKGAFRLTKGEDVWDGKKKSTRLFHSRDLTNAQCLKIYNSALTLGFFQLKDRYENEDMDGGSKQVLKITANGKTKRVMTYEIAQKSFDKLVKLIKNPSLIK